MLNPSYQYYICNMLYIFFFQLCSVVKAYVIPVLYSGVISDVYFFPSFLLWSSFNHKTEAENVHFTLNSSSSDDGDEGDTSGTSDEDKSVIETLSSSSSGCHFSHQFLFRTRLRLTDIFFS